MSKNITAAFKAHLAQETTTLATCWKVTLLDTTTLGFTDHTRDIIFEGQLYKSSSGYVPTAVTTGSSLSVDNLELEAVLNGPDVDTLDLLSGRWDGAEIEVFWVNWADLTMGRMIMKTGTLGQITLKNSSFVAEMRGLAQAYMNIIGESSSSSCRARFGDARCKVNPATYTFTGTVQSATSDGLSFTDSSLTQPGGESNSVAISNISRALRAVVTTSVPHNLSASSVVHITGVNGVVQNVTGQTINGSIFDIEDVTEYTFSIPVDTRLADPEAEDGEVTDIGPASDLEYSAYISGGTAGVQGSSGYFAYGMVTFTSGLNIGRKMEVKEYVTGAVSLQLPMPFPINVGDTYSIIAGCGGRFMEDCVIKFANGANFRGEPHLPGIDQVLTSGGPADTLPNTGNADILV